MFSNLADWDRIFKTFENRYQHLVDRMVDWYPSGRNEFTVVLNDGTEVVYNYVDDKTRRSYIPKYDNSEVSEESWSKEFGIRLYKIMNERGISQNELSEMTGISKVSLSKYMNGKAIPSAYNARRIARALDCSMYELYEF